MNNGNEYKGLKYRVMVWKRLKEVTGKLISMKFVMFLIAIALVYFGLMESWHLFAFGVAIISIKSFEKFVASR